MDYKEIKRLIDDMGNSKIDSLKIEFPDGVKISMKKNTEKEVVIAEPTKIIEAGVSVLPAVKKQEENLLSLLKRCGFKK